MSQNWSEPTDVGVPTLWNSGNILNAKDRYVMVSMSGRIGLAWSDDLNNWEMT